ncbi:MAG: RICIN domain-containing protein [Bacteroidales bacterium]|nr:RICIN domain-containing protein [Bacteroidales bacterium]
MGLILSMGWMKAQEAIWPEFSVDDDGPWYYIKVYGSNEERKGRALTAIDKEAEGYRVYGRAVAPTDLESLESQLWRVEEGDNGNFKIINKLTGRELGNMSTRDSEQEIWVPNLPETPNTQWIIEENTDVNVSGYFRISAANPINADRLYLHQGDNWQ